MCILKIMCPSTNSNTQHNTQAQQQHTYIWLTHPVRAGLRVLFAREYVCSIYAPHP